MKIDNHPLMEQGKIVNDTLDGHIRRYNDLGRVMMSAADAYHGKTDAKTLKSMRNDYGEYGIILATLFDFTDSFKAIITHHPGSTIIKSDSREVIVPVLAGISYHDVIRIKQGLAYVQAIFKAESDTSQQIEKRLKEISGSNNIRFWTLDINGRRNYPQMAACFNCSYDYFRVYGGNFDVRGRSRGVDVSSAEGGAMRVYAAPGEYKENHQHERQSSLALDDPIKYTISGMVSGQSLSEDHFRNGISELNVPDSELRKIQEILGLVESLK